MRRNLLIITQKVDQDDDLLGFFIDWLREFSKHFNMIHVVTLMEGKYSLPSNVSVHSMGKEIGRSKILQAVKFYKLLFRYIPQSSGIFAHMSPIFAVASWPVAFIYRKKIILWYLHRSVTLRLKIAEKLCYKIVTAAKESLRIKSKKIIEVGHGININKFRTERDWVDNRLRILSVGRISKIKNYEILLRAAKKLRDQKVNFTVKIVGQPVMKPDFTYLESLKILEDDLQLDNSIDFVGFVSHDKITEYYNKADVVVGLTPEGGIDKTILEGMASGCIVLTSNNACRKYFGRYADQLIFDYRNPRNLAQKVISLNQLSSENKKEVSDFLLQSVLDNHKLQNLINKLSSLYV